MNSTLRKVLTVALLTVTSILLMAVGAEATHGRYGTISWFAPNPAQPNVITIRMESAWRRSYPWGFTPVVGSVTPAGFLGSLLITRTTGGFTLSPAPDVRVTVTSVNAAEDYFVGEYTVTVTLPVGNADYLISFENCCRISTLREGNNDVPLRLQARARVQTPVNRAPVSSLLPIMKLQVNALNSFVIPAFDPDGDPVTFSFSALAESGLSRQIPNGSSTLNPALNLQMTAAGQITWTPQIAGLYAMQLRAADNKGASIPIDVILDVGAGSGTAPTLKINGATGPANFSVQVGLPISFQVTANDADIDPNTGLANTFVTLSSGGLPIGSAMSPSLPSVQRVPFSSTFNWTPTTPGTFPFVFAATDGSGKQTITSVTIQVLNNLAPVLTCPANQSVDAVDASGATLTFNVGARDPENLAFSVAWSVGATQVEVDNVAAGAGATTVSLTRTLPIGTHTISVRADDGRLDGVSTCSFTAEVKKRPQTIDFTTVDPQAYGGEATLSATAASGLPVTFTVVSGPATISGNVVSFHGAADVVVEASQGGDAVWAAAPAVPQTITVNRVGLSVRVNDAQRGYGAGNPPFTVSYTGFVNGDNSSDLGGTLAFNTAANGTSVVGSYPVSASGLTSDNYSISFVEGSLEVIPAGLSITIEPASAVYGEVPGPYTLKYTGFQNGEAPAVLIGTATFATSAVQGSPVGTYNVTPGSVTALNYTIAFAPGVLTITPRSLTVTADPSTKIYGAALPPFTATFNGFAAGDGQGSLTGTLTFATTADAASDVGNYSVTPGSVSSPNYDIAFQPGTLAITPALLTVDVNDQTRPYGEPNPTFTVSYSGFVDEDDSSALAGTLAFTTAADVNSDVGSYPVTASGLTSLNYNVTFQPGTLHVTGAGLTITIEPATAVYGNVPGPYTLKYAGFRNSDTPAVVAGTASFITTAVQGSPVGNYNVTPAGITAPNYIISFAPGVLEITRRGLTVTTQPAAKLYGAPLPSFNVSYNGFAGTDTQALLTGTLTFATTATAASPIGGYPVTPGGLNSSNYDIDFVAGTLTVNPAPLSVVAHDKTRPYGGSNPTLTGALTGVVNSDPITATFATAAVQTSDVGSYPITPTLNDPNSRLGNYTVSSQNGSLVITAAPLAVVVDDKSRQVGESNPPLTGAITGIKNGDPITATYTTTATPASAPGSYSITATLNDPAGKLGNYAVSIDAGTLVVGYGVCLQYDTTKTHKRGSTIPIKLQLCDADGQNLSSPAIVLTAFEVLFVSSAVSGDPEDSGSANPDGNFRYVDSGYIFNLQTKGLRIGTYHLRFRATGDPTVHIAPFQVR
jgi:hypothetical protein